MSKWSAFIDLLGTKESSRLGAREFATAMRVFAEELRSRQAVFAGSATIFHFSDSAFVEVADNLEARLRFLTLLNAIRIALFEKGFFFKCAVVTGGLQPDTGSLPGLVSYMFSDPSGVRAYEQQEAFKGIGCIIDAACVREFDNEMKKPDAKKRASELATQLGTEFLIRDLDRSPFIWSFFLAAPDRSDPTGYFDLRLPSAVTEPRGGLYRMQGGLFGDDVPIDTSSESSLLLREIFLRFAKAKTKSAAYGRYYLPLLAAVASSSDFRGVGVSEQGIVSGPPIVTRFFRRDTLRSFADVAGIGLLGLYVINLALNGIVPASRERLLDAFGAWLNERPFVAEMLRLRVPPELLSEENKDDLLESLARLALSRIDAGEF
jgi:hypothetical protein